MRIRDYSRRDKFVESALRYANENVHGYDQSKRWGPDYDCSSLVYTCAYEAGYNVNTQDPRYTGTIRRDFTSVGFTCCAFDGNLYDLDPGDILLNELNHVAIALGNGMLVEASGNEFGGITGGIAGDQTGNEIHVGNVYNYPWQYVLTCPEDYVEIPDPVVNPSRRGTIYEYHGGDNQKFGIIHNEDGSVSLIDMQYKLALDVNGNIGVGTPVNFVQYNGSDWQKWYIVQMPNTTNPDSVAPHVIISKLDPNFVLDADSTYGGANTTKLQTWPNASATNRNQSWYIEDNLDGTWTIRSVSWPKQVIDVGVLC